MIVCTLLTLYYKNGYNFWGFWGCHISRESLTNGAKLKEFGWRLQFVRNLKLHINIKDLQNACNDSFLSTPTLISKPCFYWQLLYFAGACGRKACNSYSQTLSLLNQRIKPSYQPIKLLQMTSSASWKNLPLDFPTTVITRCIGTLFILGHHRFLPPFLINLSPCIYWGHIKNLRKKMAIFRLYVFGDSHFFRRQMANLLRYAGRVSHCLLAPKKVVLCPARESKLSFVSYEISKLASIYSWADWCVCVLHEGLDYEMWTCWFVPGPVGKSGHKISNNKAELNKMAHWHILLFEPRPMTNNIQIFHDADQLCA